MRRKSIVVFLALIMVVLLCGFALASEDIREIGTVDVTLEQ